jgi:hypothetical protein
VAVVDDANEFASAGFDLDADACGAGVERIFEELFDDGGRAFDDFTGGDLIRHNVREDSDATHEEIVVGRTLGKTGAQARASYPGKESRDDSQIEDGRVPDLF